MIFDGYFAKVRVIGSFQNRVKVVPWQTKSILIIYLYLYLSVYYCTYLAFSEPLLGSKIYKSLPFYASTPPVGVKMVYEINLFLLPASVQTSEFSAWIALPG